MTWQDIYLESFNDVSTNVKKLKGITLAFNTNIDMIYDFDSEIITNLIQKLRISNIDLFKNIKKKNKLIC